MSTTLTPQEVNQVQRLVRRVNDWAREHASIDFTYGSRQSYWANAVNAGVVTRAQYDMAKIYFGNLWTYRGD